jgi:hypothetical protein
VRKLYTLREALERDDLLGKALPGETWIAWRALLLAIVGEPLTPEELVHFRELTGRDEPPTEQVDEFWAVVGRRGGKTRAIAVLAVYFACLCDFSEHLVSGERAVAMCLSLDRGQAKLTLDYADGIIQGSSTIKETMAPHRTSDCIELANGIDIEVHTASMRRTRGYTAIIVIGDEAAFWYDDDSANPADEILDAVRPTLATTNGILAVMSSPHARKGPLWDTFKAHFGSTVDPSILVAHGSTQRLHPTISQKVIDRAYERNPAKARAEYGAEFRTDVEGYVSLETLEACTDDIAERPFDRNHSYVAFVDPSGGSNDSMTLGIAHKEGKTAVLDLIREAKAPFQPEAVVEEFCGVMKKYQISTCRGDRYAGEWPAEQFRKRGVNYEVSEMHKSEIYLHLLPMLNSRTASLLKNKTMQTQFQILERNVRAGGKEVVDHPDRKNIHDDVANAAAGALAHVDRGIGLSPKNFNRRIEYRNVGVA